MNEIKEHEHDDEADDNSRRPLHSLRLRGPDAAASKVDNADKQDREAEEYERDKETVCEVSEMLEGTHQILAVRLH